MKSKQSIDWNPWISDFMKSMKSKNKNLKSSWNPSNSRNPKIFMKSKYVQEIQRNSWNRQKSLESTEIHEIQDINNFKKKKTWILWNPSTYSNNITNCIGHPVREEFFLSQKLQIIGVGNYPLIRMSDLLLFPLFLSISHGCSTLCCCWWVLLAREQFEWINWGVLLPVSPPWLRALYVTLKTK